MTIKQFLPSLASPSLPSPNTMVKTAAVLALSCAALLALGSCLDPEVHMDAVRKSFVYCLVSRKAAEVHGGR